MTYRPLSTNEMSVETFETALTIVFIGLETTLQPAK